jgi:hypothetical protein
MDQGGAVWSPASPCTGEGDAVGLGVGTDCGVGGDAVTPVAEVLVAVDPYGNRVDPAGGAKESGENPVWTV